MRWYGSLDFSWGFHLDGGRLLEWLDHFYIGDWIACRGGQFGSRLVLPFLIMLQPCHTWSNQSPLFSVVHSFGVPFHSNDRCVLGWSAVPCSPLLEQSHEVGVLE